MSNYIGQANVERFVDGDLVLVRNGLNPQIRFAIGRIDGNDMPGDKVQLRLLHVLRAWGHGGCGRPDDRLIQAIHSGLGNYAEFRRGDAMKISAEVVAPALQMTASELAAQLFSQREVSKYAEDAGLPAIASNVRVRLLDGLVVAGVVTGHGQKDGMPTFDFEYDHRTPEGQILKATNWAWTEQVQRSLLKSMEGDERYVVVRLCIGSQRQYLGRVSSLKEFEEYRDCCGFDKSDIAIQDWKPQG